MMFFKMKIIEHFKMYETNANGASVILMYIAIQHVYLFSK